MVDDESKEVLKGTTLEVYQFMIKNGKPVGTREVQRALNLSSPSVAAYHLTKLEDVGLLKKESGGFIVNRFLLENSIKISRFLIPRYFFFLIFTIAALSIELTLLRPTTIYREYAFSIVVTSILAIFFSYESLKTWRRGHL